MSLPELVTIHTSLITDLGDAIRERFGVSGDKTLTELKGIVLTGLPAAYQQVDYIEASGSQYIDMPYKIDLTHRFVVDFQYTATTSGDTTMFNGAASSADSTPYNSTGFWGLRNSDGKFISQWARCELNDNAIAGDADTNRHTWDLASGSQKFDGVEYHQSVMKQGYASTNNYRLFAWNPSWYTTNRCCIMRLFSFKAYKNGNLINHLIPCYRKADSVIGLYDITQGVFYTNAGSGSFTCYPSPT